VPAPSLAPVFTSASAPALSPPPLVNNGYDDDENNNNGFIGF
jgi:hypothetical protein